MVAEEISLMSTRGLTRAIQKFNVEQDHNFDGDGDRAFYGSGGSHRAIVHPLRHARSKGLSVKLLR
jgi:hypothetical protein